MATLRAPRLIPDEGNDAKPNSEIRLIDRHANDDSSLWYARKTIKLGSTLSTSQAIASTSIDSDTERLPSCLHCEMCDLKFKGSDRKGNLARHTRLKHYWEKEHRYASLNKYHSDDRGAERSLETASRKEDLLWLSGDIERFRANANMRDLLYSSDGRHENHWLKDRTHQRLTKLELLEHLHARRPDDQCRISLRPHGIMHTQKRGCCDTVATAAYAVGQFVSCLAMRNYELRHSVSAPGKFWLATSRVFPDKLWVTLSTWKPDQIPPLSASLKHYRNPSAFLFVCFGLLYGTTVLLQYRLNHRDIYQYMAVPTGIAGGVIVLAASTCFACDDPMVASTLALSVSTAMILSMCMHAIWRMLVVPSSVRLQRQVEEWMKECALETRDTEKHVLFEETF